jgi:hypothetical protein
MNTRHFVLTVIAALFVGACGTAASPERADPAMMAQGFYEALNSGDLEAAMALVSAEVKQEGDFPVPDRETFRSLLQTMINNGERQEISNLRVEGDTATYDWELYSKDGALVVRGVETLHVKDGLIVLFETHAR